MRRSTAASASWGMHRLLSVPGDGCISASFSGSEQSHPHVESDKLCILARLILPSIPAGDALTPEFKHSDVLAPSGGDRHGEVEPILGYRLCTLPHVRTSWSVSYCCVFMQTKPISKVAIFAGGLRIRVGHRAAVSSARCGFRHGSPQRRQC